VVAVFHNRINRNELVRLKLEKYRERERKRERTSIEDMVEGDDDDG
jgi:hypothetical protein